ncbi:MAG TPA: SagB/ThcOx family dehydrogenase [Solirubrobacteraceae bacterium]|nr:SagB/ThcOx family dehydrogenase [Solirubrobacteraceae bacterium]
MSDDADRAPAIREGTFPGSDAAAAMTSPAHSGGAPTRRAMDLVAKDTAAARGANERLTRRRFVVNAGAGALLGATGTLAGGCGRTTSTLPVRQVQTLPPPRSPASGSLQAALTNRRSHRQFTRQPLTESEISGLLWAAQGVTAAWGGRTAPSAGALYPLELYLLTPTAYRHYRPDGHRTELLAPTDVRAEAAAAALHQPAVATAALVIVITAVYARTVKKYGARGRRYVQLEAGHAAQNILLQAVATGLSAVPIGAFDDRRLAQSLRLPGDHAPLYIVAVGYPRIAATGAP